MIRLCRGDSFAVSSVKECCRRIFGCDPVPRRATFVPATLRIPYGERYVVQFAHFDRDSPDGLWRNTLTDGGDTIVQRYLGSDGHVRAVFDARPETHWRLVFCRNFGARGQTVGFTFLGVFRYAGEMTEDGRYCGTRYERTADTVALDTSALSLPYKNV